MNNMHTASLWEKGRKYVFLAIFVVLAIAVAIDEMVHDDAKKHSDED